jgi:alkylhydroperoxidase family enzyme
VIADPRAVALRGTPARVRVLAQLVVLVTETPWALTRADRERAHGAGLTDDEILHAVALSAYFGHLNRVADAVAVPLDYVVQLPVPHAEPATPPLAPAPHAVHGGAAIALSSRPATAAAIEAWRAYVMDRDQPLPRDTRRAIARWVAALLGDASSEMATAVDVLDAELRKLAEVVTLAPWRLGAPAYVALRARGMDDATLFDAVVVASTAGVQSRIAVALAALAR